MDFVESGYRSLDKKLTALVFNGFSAIGVPLSEPSTCPGSVLVATPTPVILGVGFYLVTVFLGVAVIKGAGLKPRTSDPFLLRMIVIVHNLFLAGLSLYMCSGILIEAVKNRYTLWGNAFKATETKMCKLLFLFYASKYLEFVDTFIMLLKRNVRQVSVLHVYHHSTIALIWWVVTSQAPGGEAYFSAFLNSGVHVFMYTYYMLAAILGKDERKRKRYLWWGRYLTQMQMFQFALNWVQAAYNLSDKNSAYPRFLNQILFYYMITLLVLFANFYIRKYAEPKKEKTSSGGRKKNI